MGIFSRTLYFSSLTSLSRTTSTLFTILLFLAVSILSLSPSASAEPCTPTFVIDEDDADEFASDQLSKPASEYIVREGLSFKMLCTLSDFNTIKWTINGREITPQLQDELDIHINRTQKSSRGFQHTELTVYNATHVHNGEYKCTSVCSSNAVGANVGVKVVVSIAINITLNGETKDSGRTYTKFAAKDKSTELICTAKATNAAMKWKRVNDDKKEEDMEVVCNEKDIPQGTDSKYRPPPHCTLELKEDWRDSAKVTVHTLSFYRLRKEPNDTRGTLSDFRRYICTAKSEGNQEGSAALELLEMKERFRRSEGNDYSTSIEREKNETVSANRYFGKGHTTLTVVQGNKLEIYCDINGVTKGDLESGSIKVNWLKDGQELDITPPKPGMSTLFKEKPLRTGFVYDMAEPENRGVYTCIIKGKVEVAKYPQFEYYVRVKDKLGALWPFLAICGEVVILCTIILIYEQRRNKAEMEESDTDGSPDQKNSNDDGD